MEKKTPDHEIYHTLENIKKEAEANPDQPMTKSLAHKIAFLDKNLTDKAVSSTKRSETCAFWAAVFAFIALLVGIAQLAVELCSSK